MDNARLKDLFSFPVVLTAPPEPLGGKNHQSEVLIR